VSSNSSFDHCVVCSSSIYGFWLPLWCLQTRLLTIVLSVHLRYNDSGCPFGFFKLVFWPLCCLFVFDIMILTIPLVSSNSSFDHCVVCSSSIYGFWLPLWCLQTLPLTFILCVRLRYKDSDYPCGVFTLFSWPLCCLFVFDITILTTPLVSSIYSFDHCVVCSSSIYGLWLPLWCLQTLLLTIVLSVRLRYKDSDYPFGVFKLFVWPLCCLFIFDIRILTTPLVSSISSFGHCVVCSSSI
jgi:predicted nucleic acid-binding Zn ribbon protein